MFEVLVFIRNGAGDFDLVQEEYDEAENVPQIVEGFLAEYENEEVRIEINQQV